MSAPDLPPQPPYPQPPYIQPPFGQSLPWAPPPVPPQPWARPDELRAAATMAGALAVAGVLAAVVWRLWTVKTHGFDIGSGVIIPDETEGWIGADAHFAIITGLVGLVAGALAWRLRTVRGPVLMGGLVVGALAGSGLTALVGHLLAGGNHRLQPNTNFVERLPVSLHAHGLLTVEAVGALLVYLGCALVTDRDDLGARPASPGAQNAAQGLRRDGDGPGSAEQGYLSGQ